ncbi:MAG: DUF1579 domain-containing protein [Ignavibacteriaceae bacterium]|nr:DUF1579 domain-containing protein [Ignavibacteriaceae bacterium]
MKNLRLTVLIAALILSGKLFAQSEEDMKAYMEFMTPGKQHQAMAEGAGKWNTTIKWWMDPKAEPAVTEGEVTAEMILGGRYLMEKHTSMMMGMPFEGMSLTGYDNTLGRFFSTWIDNMGTGIMYSTGTWNEEKKRIEWQGTMTDPMLKTEMPVKQYSWHDGKDKMVMEMYVIVPGGEYKNMEVVMTRAK